MNYDLLQLLFLLFYFEIDVSLKDFAEDKETDRMGWMIIVTLETGKAPNFSLFSFLPFPVKLWKSSYSNRNTERDWLLRNGIHMGNNRLWSDANVDNKVKRHLTAGFNNNDK